MPCYMHTDGGSKQVKEGRIEGRIEGRTALSPLCSLIPSLNSQKFTKLFPLPCITCEDGDSYIGIIDAEDILFNDG